MTGLKHTKLLLVDDDPAIRRLLAKWLAPAGYEIVEAADGAQAMQRVRDECPDIVITDWEMPNLDGIALCRWLREQELSKYVYVIFLSIRCGSDDMIRGLEAGADDFLKKPIDKGELLARLRAGARVLELESRLTLLAKTDSLTGLETRRTLFDSVAEKCASAVRQGNPLCCVLVDIDHLQRINDVHGPRVGDDVIRRVGRTVLSGCRVSDAVARYKGECFAVLLADTGEEGALMWASRIRQAIGALEFPVDTECLRVSASCGVAQLSDEMQNDPQRLIGAAEEALLVAKRSGRDRVVGHRSLTDDGPAAILEEPAADFFDQVTARDVMTTIVAGLNKRAKVGNAADYFLRFRIPSAPVVDDDGRLVGILSERDVMGVMLWPDWSNTRIEQAMKTNVITYEEATPVMKIYEFLCRVPVRAVVIVNNGQPTGILSRSSLVRFFTSALIAQKAAESADGPAEFVQEDSIKRLGSLAHALRDEAERIVAATSRCDPELMPALVGGASRVQELVNDLLASSRAAESRLVEV